MTAPDERPYRRALASAMRILARRDHSVAELTHKLRARAHSEDLVQRVIAECLRLNYLDDERTARQLVARMKRRGWGAHRIRSDLLGRGLAEGREEGYLREAIDWSEELILARGVALRKLRSVQSVPDPIKRRQRMQRFLRSRGFTDSVVIEVLGEIDFSS